MSWSAPSELVYQWSNSPSTGTPLDETHLEASETVDQDYAGSVGRSIARYGKLGPWLGIGGNRTTVTGADNDYFVKRGWVWDRLEILAGQTNDTDGTNLITHLTTLIGTTGNRVIVLISPAGYSGPGSMVIPTGTNKTTYASQFVTIVQSVLAAFPNEDIPFEIVNEPWLFTSGNANDYADLVKAVLDACVTAGIDLTRIYAMPFNATWITSMYTQQATLKTLLQGWTFHPYGSPGPGMDMGNGAGIGMVAEARKAMTAGTNNIMISEVGFRVWYTGKGAMASSDVWGEDQAADYMYKVLNQAAMYRAAGWLKCLLWYHKTDQAGHSPGWALMNSATGALFEAGEQAVAWPARTNAVPAGPEVASGMWLPQDGGFRAVTVPGDDATGTLKPTTQRIYAFMMRVDHYGFAGSLYSWITVAGSGLTAGQNWLGIYDEKGYQMAQVGTDSLFTGTSGRTAAINVNMMAQYVWVLVLSVGTTPPTFAAKPVGPAVNHQSPWGGQPKRAMWSDSTFTTLPANTDFTGPWSEWPTSIIYFGLSRS